MRPQLDMFGAPDPAAVHAVAPTAAQRQIAPLIPPLIRMGTSSWSFPGWNGIVYDGAYSETQLARNGLPAYAEHALLRAVGIDRSYYAPLDADVYAQYARAVGDDFRFLIKAERLLVQPDLDDGRGGSVRNDRFLDAQYATEYVVDPVMAGLGEKAGPILFQFSPMHPARVGGPQRFATMLGDFLRSLPAGPLYAVELRTPELFTRDYLIALTAADAVHGYTVHGSMLPLERQLAAIPAGTQQALVIRWMLHAKHGYNEARAAYAPFDRIVDEDALTRDQIVAAAVAAADENREAYVIVNNKAEGSSPLSVFGLAERLTKKLAARGR